MKFKFEKGEKWITTCSVGLYCEYFDHEWWKNKINWDFQQFGSWWRWPINSTRFENGSFSLLSKLIFCSGFQKILNLENSEEEVDKILEAVDTNGSGAIDYMGMLLN